MFTVDQYLPDQFDNEPSKKKSTTYDPSLATELLGGALGGSVKGVEKLKQGTKMALGADRKEASKKIQDVNKTIDEGIPNAGLAKDLTSGLFEYSPAVVAGLGTGGWGAIALGSTVAGVTSFGGEYSDLTIKHKVDDDNALESAILKGIGDGVGFALPLSGFSKSIAVDLALATMASTAVGVGTDYLQGVELEASGYDKLGKKKKEQATSVENIALNAGGALALGGVANAVRHLRNTESNPNSTGEQLDDASFNLDNEIKAEQTNLLNDTNIVEPNNVNDNLKHEESLNAVMEQIANGRKIDIGEINTKSKYKTLEQITPNNKATGVDIPSIPKQPTAVKFKSNGNKTAVDVYDTAKKYGFNDNDAVAIVALAEFESGFKTNIKNKNSSATGIFQFTDSTWRLEGGTSANRYDYKTQIELGVKHQVNNIKYVKDKTGYTLTGSEIYMPHLLGRGGAVSLRNSIKNNPNMKARDAIRKFSDNPDKLMRINGIPKNATASEAWSIFKNHIDQRITKYGGDANAVSHPINLDSNVNIDIQQVQIRSDIDIATISKSKNIDVADTVDILNNITVGRGELVSMFEMKNPTNIQTDLPNFNQGIEMSFNNARVESQATYANAIRKGDDIDLSAKFEQTIDIPNTNKKIGVNKADEVPLLKEVESKTDWTSVKNKDGDYQTRTIRDKENNSTITEIKKDDVYVRREKINDSETVTVTKGDKSYKVNNTDGIKSIINNAVTPKKSKYSNTPIAKELFDELDKMGDQQIAKGEDILTAKEWKDKIDHDNSILDTLETVAEELALCTLDNL